MTTYVPTLKTAHFKNKQASEINNASSSIAVNATRVPNSTSLLGGISSCTPNKFSAHSSRHLTRRLRSEFAYNWRSPEQPVTTGIALARSLRSPGYPGSDTMRCVSCRLCDTRAGLGAPPPQHTNTHTLPVHIGASPPPNVSRLAICQRFGCLRAAITERTAKGTSEARARRSAPRSSLWPLGSRLDALGRRPAAVAASSLGGRRTTRRCRAR